MDLLFIENPKEKNKLNYYLNENKEFVKNNLKYRKTHLTFYNNSIKGRKEEQLKYPVPKILYSTSENFFLDDEKKKQEIIEKESPKIVVQELVDVVNKFAEDLDFDEDNKSLKSSSLSQNQDNEMKDIKKINIVENKENKEKEREEFFVTGKTRNALANKKFQEMEKTLSGNELLNDLKFAKAKSTPKPITSSEQLKAIKTNKNAFKDNLLFENYGKYKFTRTGLTYPKSLNKYELPKFNGKNKTEKDYYNFRKKVGFPNLVYNQLPSFSEALNKDLGKINKNYGKIKSRTRFTENPLMKRYMEMIPVYEIYKDLKQIENRYIGSKYKFKLLPLYNKRLSNLDKFAERFYRAQNAKGGLASLLNIQNSNSVDKTKKKSFL